MPLMLVCTNFLSNQPFFHSSKTGFYLVGLTFKFCFSEIFLDLENKKKDIKEKDVLDEYERRKRIKEDRERYEVILKSIC